jgi:hypothetical protein
MGRGMPGGVGSSAVAVRLHRGLNAGRGYHGAPWSLAANAERALYYNTRLQARRLCALPHHPPLQTASGPMVPSAHQGTRTHQG